MGFELLDKALTLLGEMTGWDGIYPRFYLTGGQTIHGKYKWVDKFLVVLDKHDLPTVVDPQHVTAVQITRDDL